MASSSSNRQLLSLDDLDCEDDDHSPECTSREPSKCHCDLGLTWIYASKPDPNPKYGKGGKWMIFVPANYVDQTWKKVKTLLCSNKLGMISV